MASDASVESSSASVNVDPERAAKARRNVAELTSTSWRTIPHFYLRLEADVTAALALARPTTIFCAASARALARHPECNLEWQGERLVRRERVDLGLLVDTPNGLLLPIVRAADRLALSDLAGAIGEAAARARSSGLKRTDFGPRSLTVSNLGMFAVDSFSGVIAPPDVLLLAVGRIRTVPRWYGEVFRPRQVADLTLSVDHRAIDGADAGRFLTALESILADPDELA
jgi:pyruvate dehydrogenase E2 component (dihydrolipoamide acetyltransferase)